MSFSDISKCSIMQHESFLTLRLHGHCLNSYISGSYGVKSVLETSQDFTMSRIGLFDNHKLSLFVRKLSYYRDFTLSCEVCVKSREVSVLNLH